MPLKGVCIELRPNLSSGYVVLQFDQDIRDREKTRIVIKEHDVHIVENGVDSPETKLLLRNDSFGMDMQHISSFVVSFSHICFRFNYTKIDLESLYKSGGVQVELQPLMLSFSEGKDLIALHCSKCRCELVPGCTYNRLREFPSGMIDPSEFFCHSHNHGTEPAKQPTLVPGPSDLYYGLNHIVINMAVLQARIINSAGHLYCKRCMWMLGHSILSGAAAKLWADALYWLAVKPQAVSSPDGPVEEPRQRQLFHHATVSQFMLRLLSDLWSPSLAQFSPASSRALLTTTMPNRHQHYMLLHVLEPNLCVLRRVCKDQGKLEVQVETGAIAEQLHYVRACKLYFRVVGSCQQEPKLLEEWERQHTHIPKLEVSPYLFLELQSRLDLNTQLVPHAWRYNTFQEKLLLSYFFFENEQQEQVLQEQQQQKQQQPMPAQTEKVCGIVLSWLLCLSPSCIPSLLSLPVEAKQEAATRAAQEARHVG